MFIYIFIHTYTYVCIYSWGAYASKQLRKRKWLEELKIQEERNRRVFKDRKEENKGIVENSQKAYRSINRNNYFQSK